VIQAQGGLLLVRAMAGMAALRQDWLDVFDEIHRAGGGGGEAQEKKGLQHHGFIRWNRCILMAPGMENSNMADFGSLPTD
jgi:hypothetical protein